MRLSPLSKRIRAVLAGILLVLALPTSGTAETEFSKGEVALTTLGLGVSVALELVFKDRLAPEKPHFTVPNRMDAHLRESLLWSPSRRDRAVVWSDRLLYGVSLSSLVWGPALAADRNQAALINLEVFSVNSLLTNAVKLLSARERPYHYYGTRPDRGSDDFASFYSGHSSIAFSQAVTNAMILSQAYPEEKHLIWSSCLATAGLTAYFRLAGDMHYFSDVLIGGSVGSLIAWRITSWQLNRTTAAPDSGEFHLLIKIPLG